MNFLSLAQFASRLFGGLTIAVVAVAVVLVSQSYSKTIEPVEEINLLNYSVSKAEETRADTAAEVARLTALVPRYTRNCEADLEAGEVEVPRSCTTLQTLPSRISEAELELAQVEGEVFALESEIELKRAQVAAERVYQAGVVESAIYLTVVGTALWIAFTLVYFWKRESSVVRG